MPKCQLGFRFQGLGFGVWCFRVQGLGFGVLGFRAQGLSFQGLGQEKIRGKNHEHGENSQKDVMGKNYMAQKKEKINNKDNKQR